MRIDQVTAESETGLKQGHEELLATEEYLDAILWNLPVGVAILEGPDFRYFRINKWLAELNGLSVEDHLGKSVAEVLPDSQQILANLRKVRNENKATLNREITITLPGDPDKPRHLLESHFPITVAGERKAIGAVVLDITARKRAEETLGETLAQLEQQVEERTAELVRTNEALKTENAERRKTLHELERSERHLRALLETTHVVPWTADAKTFQFTYVGPSAVELLGYTTDQWYEGDFWPDHIHPDDRKEALEFCIESSSRKDTYEFEYRMIAADGRAVWLHDLVSIERQNGIATKLSGFLIDITDRKLAEQVLQKSEATLASVMRNAPDGIVVVRSDGILALTNTQAETMFGYACDELTGKPLDMLLPQDKRDTHFHHVAGYVAAPTTRPMGSELELSGLRKDGTEFPVEISLSPLDDGGGQILCVIRDVTAQKRSENERSELRTQLTHVSRVATIGELTSSIAHELNQPLCAIVNNSRAGRILLARQGADPDDLRAILDDVTAAGIRGGEIIDRLRGLLKKDTRDHELFDFNEAIYDVLSLVGSDAQARGVSLRRDLTTGMPAVKGDRVQLQQVVLNLILNGFEAMDTVAPDQRALTLATSIGEAGSVRLEVRDSGVGFDSEHGDQIFEPFFTTKSEGMGMGLSITRSIIEAHGGRIWAIPNSDRGTIVGFAIPFEGVNSG